MCPKSLSSAFTFTSPASSCSSTSAFHLLSSSGCPKSSSSTVFVASWTLLETWRHSLFPQPFLWLWPSEDRNAIFSLQNCVAITCPGELVLMGTVSVEQYGSHGFFYGFQNYKKSLPCLLEFCWFTLGNDLTLGSNVYSYYELVILLCSFLIVG